MITKEPCGVCGGAVYKDAEIVRLVERLRAIHEICCDPDVPAWQKLQNIEATARED